MGDGTLKTDGRSAKLVTASPARGFRDGGRFTLAGDAQDRLHLVPGPHRYLGPR